MHIPYNGGNPRSWRCCLGRWINFDNLATAAANIRAGKLKALAVTTAQRSAFARVPAVAEIMPSFEVLNWWGLVAPAATPREVISKLNSAFGGGIALPEGANAFCQLSSSPCPPCHT